MEKTIDEIKNIISHMVNVGLVLEEKLNEINESAESLKEEANNFLNSFESFVSDCFT